MIKTIRGELGFILSADLPHEITVLPPEGQAISRGERSRVGCALRRESQGRHTAALEIGKVSPDLADWAVRCPPIWPISEKGVPVEKGLFGQYMHVTSINDGPVTFLLDSAKLF